MVEMSQVKEFLELLAVVEEMTKDEWSHALGVNLWAKPKKFDTVWLIRTKEGVTMATKILEDAQIRLLFSYAVSKRAPQQ